MNLIKFDLIVVIFVVKSLYYYFEAFYCGKIEMQNEF